MGGAKGAGKPADYQMRIVFDVAHQLNINGIRDFKWESYSTVVYLRTTSVRQQLLTSSTTQFKVRYHALKMASTDH